MTRPTPSQIREAAGRFWFMIDPPSGSACRLWRGYVKQSRFGYGELTVLGHPVLAHRMAWALTNGPIKSGLCVLHRCDNPPCCNPDHLFLGTYSDNRADCVAKGRQAKGPTHGSRTKPWTVRAGELNGRAVLTAEDVKVIRKIHLVVGITTIARRYGIKKAAVWKIVHRVNWRHV